ncbi:aspartyl-phosphate phosphatase Spo0E family protein [Bacillus songklensis]|uniref:Aspartyl-phosphate phosphatase Spo0E family protein n=1 Tax=Bacillus songklensis TaxID=1069116 RepID=A0ABV8AY77_9BACI
MHCEKLLLDEIEKCRLLMVHLASQTSLSSHQVVQASTRLDTLLNQYNKHKKQ